MLKIKSEILLKIGRRNNWREVAFFANADETKFEVREYYGQNKLAYIKEVSRFPFDSYGVATMNFDNIVRSREIDGYEIEHSLRTTIPCMPFLQFKPPAYSCDFKTPFREQFKTLNEPVVLPIHDGKRVYIKLGSESINSIQMVDIAGNSIEAPVKLVNELQLKVKISQLECAVIEGYLESDFGIRVVDVLMMNGMAIEQPYNSRIKAIKGVLGSSNIIRYIDATANHGELKQNKARYFLVKDNTKPCGGDSTFVVPNFYSIKVLVEKAYDYRPGYYKVMFTTESGYESIGDLYSPHEELHPNIQVQIAFKEVENGLPVEFWLSPIQNKEKLTYDERGTEMAQMQNLNEYWYGL